jgi:hypothetical protein
MAAVVIGATPLVVHVTVPALPIAGIEQAQPAGVERERKVVPTGRASVQLTFRATLGPWLATTSE